MNIRNIKNDDDAFIAEIIRANFRLYDLAKPGTAYFDPELDHLSNYYNATAMREYFILTDDEGKVLGGGGFGECTVFDETAEMQKLYLSEEAKGKGYGRELIERIEKEALEHGYKQLYIETHTVLATAIKVYEHMGYSRIEKPANINHSAMNCFMVKDL